MVVVDGETIVVVDGELEMAVEEIHVAVASSVPAGRAGASVLADVTPCEETVMIELVDGNSLVHVYNVKQA